MTDEEQSDDYIEVPIMGDIREDIELAGFSLVDLYYIGGGSVLGLILIFSLPIGGIAKMVWAALLVLGLILFRGNEVGYRLFRFYHDVYDTERAEGDELPDYLDVKEDRLVYRSGSHIQTVMRIRAKPWLHATYSQKMQRLEAFEDFLHVCAQSDFVPQITSELVGDFQHPVWNRQRDRVYASEGIRKLSLARIEQQERLAREKIAERSEYILRLSIPEYKIKKRKREDEPEGLSKAELREYRMLEELQDLQRTALDALEKTGHIVEELAGFSIPELLGRQWAYPDWNAWKKQQGGWEDEMEPGAVEILSAAEDEPGLDIDYTQLNYQFELEEEPAVTEPIPETKIDTLPSEVYAKAFDLNSEDVPDDEPEGNLPVATARWRLVMQQIVRVWRLITQRFQHEAARLQTKLRRSQKLRQERKASASIVASNESSKPESVLPSIQPPDFQLQPVCWITGPGSVGKSFLAANIAVATSSEEQPLTLLDLSPDQATLTVINPVRAESEYLDFIKWTSIHAPGLSIYTPIIDVSRGRFPTLEPLLACIEAQAQQGHVLLDLPWEHPDFNELTSTYPGVGLVDQDYHHWLRWEKEAPAWDHPFWLNQVDSTMTKHMKKLVRDRYNQEPQLIFPWISEASEYVYMGRPVGAQLQYKSHFQVATAFPKAEPKEGSEYEPTPA